jgi:hypothetical protein
MWEFHIKKKYFVQMFWLLKLKHPRCCNNWCGHLISYLAVSNIILLQRCHFCCCAGCNKGDVYSAVLLYGRNKIKKGLQLRSPYIKVKESSEGKSDGCCWVANATVEMSLALERDVSSDAYAPPSTGRCTGGPFWPLVNASIMKPHIFLRTATTNWH